MSRKKQAVLDIGSDVITLAMQDNKYDNILFRASAEYDGYQDGEFLDAEGLYNAINSLITKFRDTTFLDLKEIIVGVPAEFTTAVCKTVESSFAEPRKITHKDINTIFEQGDTYGNHPDYLALNCSPVYYVLDNGRRTLEAPIGQITKGLSSFASYVLGERAFIEIFDAIGKALGIKFLYTSALLAELMFTVPITVRDNGIILVDSGYISTGVAYAKGDGILYSKAFSLGSGNIAADLTTYLEIPFEHAVELVKKINLNLSPSESDTYTVNTSGESVSYNMSDINELAKWRVTDIAEKIKRVIDTSTYEVPANAEILLTGGGLILPGVREIIETVTGHRAAYNSSDAILNLNKPNYCSLVGLLLYQRSKLPQKNKNKASGLLSGIKRFFDRRKK